MPAHARVGARLRWDEGQASSKPRGRKPRVVLRWSITARRYGDWNWGGAAGGDGGSAGLGAHSVMLASMRARMTDFGNTIPIADAISMSRGKAPPSRRLGAMRGAAIGVQSRLGVMVHLAERAERGCALGVRTSRRCSWRRRNAGTRSAAVPVHGQVFPRLVRPVVAAGATALARRPGSPCVRHWPVPVVADTMESGGKDVQQETAHELLSSQGHGLVARASLGPIVLPPEGDAALVEGEEPPVGDGHPVGVAR